MYRSMSDRSQTPKGRRARKKILRAAERLLAARGFHGTSMRDVADACGLPLASVVYHFARKEKLHGAVLAEIAAQLLAAMARARAGASDDVEAAVQALIRWSFQHPGRVRLLVRELLDNPARVSRAGALPLAPVLLGLAEAVGAQGHPEPELAVLHVVGAVSYVVIARPTVRRIVGAERDAAMMARSEDEALALARRALAPPTNGNLKEQQHASSASDRARPTSARPRRGKDDGHRSHRTDARDRSLRG